MSPAPGWYAAPGASALVFLVIWCYLPATMGCLYTLVYAGVPRGTGPLFSRCWRWQGNEGDHKGKGIHYKESCHLWVARVQIGVQVNGKPKYKELSASTQRLLLEKKEAFLKDLQAGWLSENTLASATFSQYLDLWLASVKRSRHLSTWQSYERCVRLHIKPTLGGYKMTDLRAIRFEAAFAERAANGCSVGNRKKIAEVIHAALEHAVRTDVLPRNPFALVKPTSTPAEIVPFAVDEIGRI